MLNSYFIKNTSNLKTLVSKFQLFHTMSQKCNDYKTVKLFYSISVPMYTGFIKNISLINKEIYCTLLSSKPIVRYKQTGSFYMGLEVKNNVILYKHTSPSFPIKVHLWGSLQTIGLAVLAYCSFTSDILKVNTNSVTEFFKDSQLRYIIFLVSAVAAPISYILSWFIVIRTVKYVILNKGGKSITLSTYHPFKKQVQKVVSLENVKCLGSISQKCNVLPIKIKGSRLKYLIERQEGTYVNEDLFRAAIGFYRK